MYTSTINIYIYIFILCSFYFSNCNNAISVFISMIFGFLKNVVCLIYWRF